MVEWSLAAFRAAPSVGAIVVACPPGCLEDLRGDDLVVVEGGETRSDSVANALEAVATELVAIHDAARPLVTSDLIEDVVATLAGDPDADGVIAAAPVTDTIKRAAPTSAPKPVLSPGKGALDAKGSTRAPKPVLSPGKGALDAKGETNAPKPGLSPGKGALVVGGTVDRGELWAAQTPQVFRVEALRRALETHRHTNASATDEAMLIEAVGGRVLIHPGPPENLKVTTPDDLRVAELLLSERSRVG